MSGFSTYFLNAVTTIEAATESSVTDEDAILLGGQTFAIRGPVRGQPVSEFETGFKTGRAKYDNREHAFFLVYDDYSGGFGHRFLDLDADVGTFWDTNPDNAPDWRRPGHLTLAPKLSITVLPNGTGEASYPVGRRPGKNWLLFDGAAYFMAGATVYFHPRGTSTTLGYIGVYTHVPWGGVGPGGLNPGSLALLSDGAAGNGSRIYAFFTGHGYGYGYADLGAGNAWDGNDNPAWHSSSKEREGVWDATYWDQKLVGTLGQNGIMFAIWDPDTTAEAWNFSDADDGHLLFYAPGLDQIVFIGTFRSPWGEPAVFFYSPTRGMWALDFFARKAYQIDAGLTNFMQHAIPWNGSIAFTDGFLVRLYSNENVRTITPLDIPNNGGTPASMQSSDGARRASLQYLIASDTYLYSIAQRPHPATPSLGNGGADAFFMCHNGSGWGPIGESIPDFSPQGGFQFDDASYQSVPPVHREIWSPGLYNPAGSVTTQARLARLDIPDSGQAPIVGLDHFARPGAYLIDGWTDGGFSDVDGTLYRMNIDAFSLTLEETVMVEYQLNNQEDSDWIQMVDENNQAAVFDVNRSVLYFAAPAVDGADPKKGLGFRTVRFRKTLNRGNDDTLSPEVRAFTLVYLKTPALRIQWTFTIDINRMIERSQEGNDDGGYTVDGDIATVMNVWDKLKSFWNQPTLLDLQLPNVDEASLVKISDMPLSFDDFRDAVAGKGTVDVTVLEVLAP